MRACVARLMRARGASMRACVARLMRARGGRAADYRAYFSAKQL